MADYSRYKTDTLHKMLEKVQTDYRNALERFDQLNGWGAGMRRVHCDLGIKKCDRLHRKISAIREELAKRQ